MSNTVESIENVVEVEVVAGTAEPVGEPVKVKRIKKNHTDAVIDPKNSESIEDYLGEFYANSQSQPPRKGYDQHWNKDGFINAGPTQRLPNRGAANMIAVLFDALADRATSDDAAEAADAKAFLEAMVEFGRNRIAEKIKHKQDAILAKARQIEAARQ
jgi:hypothetical protein